MQVNRPGAGPNINHDMKLQDLGRHLGEEFNALLGKFFHAVDTAIHGAPKPDPKKDAADRIVDRVMKEGAPKVGTYTEYRSVPRALDPKTQAAYVDALTREQFHTTIRHFDPSDFMHKGTPRR